MKGRASSHPSSDVRLPAFTAAALAFASAGVSLFWTLGGTFLLETVGGVIEDLARERSVGAIALGTGVTVMKTAAGALALALACPFGAPLGRRLLIGINSLAGLALILWGGINVVAGALVLGDVVTPASEVDESALRWHVFVWDLWSLSGGCPLRSLPRGIDTMCTDAARPASRGRRSTTADETAQSTPTILS